MAGEHHVVGQQDALAEPAIVRDVAIGEKYAFVADDRLAAAARRAGVHRHPLADQAIGADLQPRALAAIFQVLRFVADRGEREDAGARADFGRPTMTTCDISLTPSPSITSAPTWQNGPISTPAPIAAPRARRQALGWTRGHAATSIAETSASQTSTPSTFASPRNHQMLRRLLIFVICSRN